MANNIVKCDDKIGNINYTKPKKMNNLIFIY